MKKPYKLLILGYDPISLINSTASTQLITFCVKKEFEKLGYVEIASIPVRYPPIIKETKLPEVDYVILICYAGDVTIEQINIIRGKTKPIKIVTLREISFSIVDYSFVFNIKYAESLNTFYIPLPCPKDLLKPTFKEPKSILIDHYWEDYLNTDNDWTFIIEEWLEEIKGEHTIYRMIRFKDEYKHLRSFEIPITWSNYLTYLEATSKIENFIVTHKEGYPYGVIDMVARGTRVLTPPKFIPNCMIKDLELPVFTNKQEFISAINKPLEASWGTKIDLCTDYNKIVNIIDCKFQSWM